MKAEDSIKQQLENRRIQPTAAAWDRIESKLDAAQGKKKSRVVLWIGIAASFVAGVFLTALFFGSSGVEEQPNKIVIAPSTTEIIQDRINQPEDKFEKNSDQQVVIDEQLEREVRESPTLSRKRKKSQNFQSATIKTQIAKNTKQAIQKQSNESIAQTPLEKELTKPLFTPSKEKITDAETAIAEQNAIADAEIDALLVEAQKEITSQQIFDLKTNHIDANALLLDAEYEVDPDTFKDKIFKTLKKNFDRAVEAVVSKDN